MGIQCSSKTLDDDKFYAYNLNSDSLVKVINDKAIEIERCGDDSVLYISKSILTSSITEATYDSSTNKVNYNHLLAVSASYIQKADNSVIYYVINSLTNEKSGIYKADMSTQEPTITCLSVGKAKYLKLYNDKLFFADGANGDKLSSINTSGTNQTRSLVLNEKINNLILDNNKLYFTINNILGDYIASYNISTTVTRKLTSDAGSNLTIINDDLYYINVDVLTSYFIGNGIYKVNSNPLSDNNNPGTKVIDGGEMGVCSLTSFEDSLIYYDVNGYKLNVYDISSKEIVNILDGFVKPEDPAPLSMGSQVEEKDGIIYYLDLYDEKTLHSYNPQTKMNFRLTSLKVDNFSIIGDYIYYNAVSYGLNNDTYRVNIKTSSLPELVNTYDSKEVISDGQYIYNVERNAAVAITAIHKANID